MQLTAPELLLHQSKYLPKQLLPTFSLQKSTRISMQVSKNLVSCSLSRISRSNICKTQEKIALYKKKNKRMCRYMQFRERCTFVSGHQFELNTV